MKDRPPVSSLVVCHTILKFICNHLLNFHTNSKLMFALIKLNVIRLYEVSLQLYEELRPRADTELSHLT